jgi:hypothetical protein
VEQVGARELYLELLGAAVGAHLGLARLRVDLLRYPLGEARLVGGILLELLLVGLDLGLRYQEAAARPAGDRQEQLYVVRERYVYDRLRELYMAEVAGALRGGVAAGPAHLAGLEHAQPVVHEAAGDGQAVLVVGLGYSYLDHRVLPDLRRREYAELYRL